MTFDIDVWNGFRLEAKKIGDYLDQYRDKDRYIELDRRECDDKILQITTILKKCSSYMDKTRMKMPKPLWTYDIKDTETHLSSPDFAYGHLIK